MSEFQRYAVYYLPDDPDLAAFGASWLGWDIMAGKVSAHADVAAIDKITATPRKYGFHATLKPPFQLRDGTVLSELEQAVSALAKRRAPVEVQRLIVSCIGHFLALVPEGDVSDLGDLAFDCVASLDRYRRPPSKEELAKRRASGLTALQDAMLSEWGYPYVGDAFRFHMTLTGRLDERGIAQAREAAVRLLPQLAEPFRIGSISLVGEGSDGLFRLIHRYALSG